MKRTQWSGLTVYLADAQVHKSRSFVFQEGGGGGGGVGLGGREEERKRESERLSEELPPGLDFFDIIDLIR